MSKTLEASLARRRRVIVGGCAVLLLFAGVGTYLALAYKQPPDTTPTAPQPAEGAPVRIKVSSQPDREFSLRSIAASGDAEVFAVDVATALFEWDTTTMTSQTEYADRLVAVADPTGEESAGLVADIANYLPLPGAWANLREFATRQWLEVTSTEIPSLWPQAVVEAGPNGLLPGTAAYTIEGVRHRKGMWEGSPVSSAHEVAFTVFVVCAPTYPTCHVLRLSLPDKPLD